MAIQRNESDAVSVEGEAFFVNTWCGFERIDFEFEGHPCILVKPDRELPGRPWVWRAEFFGAFASVDEAMAREGYHVAYCSLSNRYGCPSAVEDMEKFRAMMVDAYGLNERPVLYGMSRGGLYAFNYSLKYPQYVDKLYLDCPVMGIRSWPGGKGKGEGAPDCWAECMEIYGLNEETAKTFNMNPLDRTEELAATGIPVIVVAGDTDTVVPYDENGWQFVRRFRRAGGKAVEILKPGCNHHPASLEDPTPVVRFLMKDRALM